MFMDDSEPTGMGKTLFFLMSMSFVIVTRLLLFIAAEINSNSEIEDKPQHVIVLSIIGEKPILHFPSDTGLFIKNIHIHIFDYLLFFYLVAVLNIITWMVMITSIALGVFYAL